MSALSNIAFLARLANCKVEKVYADADIDGLIQIIKRILPWPSNESLSILVNFEFLNGICVLDFSIRADMQ
jgi:hypothetical protein